MVSKHVLSNQWTSALSMHLVANKNSTRGLSGNGAVQSLVTLALAACLLLGAAVGKPAQAADAKPLAVLALADYNNATAGSSLLKKAASAPKIPVSIEALLRLYIEGQGLSSIDTARPWGAVLQIDGRRLSAYAFVPVADAKRLWSELANVIEEPQDIGHGIYRIESARNYKHVFVKVTATGWIIVGDTPEVLADAPQDPGTLVNGLNKNYDVAVQLNVANIPAYQGQLALDTLKSQLREQLHLENVIPEETLAAIFLAAEQLEQVSLGWSKHDN